MLKHAVTESADFHLPQKVSLSLASGTEVLVHGFRDVLIAHGLDPGKFLFHVDSKNAFNAILRAEFLRLFFLHSSAAAQVVHALYET